jgi:hypothetical protein
MPILQQRSKKGRDRELRSARHRVAERGTGWSSDTPAGIRATRTKLGFRVTRGSPTSPKQVRLCGTPASLHSCGIAYPLPFALCHYSYAALLNGISFSFPENLRRPSPLHQPHPTGMSGFGFAAFPECAPVSIGIS